YLIRRRNQPPISPSLNKLQRRSHPVCPDHRQPRRKPLRHHEPPPVIPRRHTQHIRACILARQLIPIFESCEFNAVTHRRERLLKRLPQLPFPNYLQSRVNPLAYEPNKSSRQQIHTLALDQRTRKQKHAFRTFRAISVFEALQIREIRQVEILASRTKLSAILIDRKLPNPPNRNRRSMQLRQFPLSQKSSRPRRLSQPRPLTPETPWTSRRRSLLDQLFRAR